MNGYRAGNKVLAIGNLHYYSKESVHRKFSWLKYSDRPVSCSLNYSNGTFISPLGNPLWKNPGYASVICLQIIFDAIAMLCQDTLVCVFAFFQALINIELFYIKWNLSYSGTPVPTTICTLEMSVSYLKIQGSILQ